MIHRRLILSPGLNAMAPVIQGIPVAAVPEEVHVTAMRDDVVDIRCLHVPAFLHALQTQRVRLKVLLPGFLPSSPIASARSRPYLFRMHRLVSVAILLS